MTAPASLELSASLSAAADPLASLFDAQRSHRRTAPRTTADERIARLRALKSSLLAHREALCAAMRGDFSKHGAEVEIAEIQPTLAEIDYTIAHLRRWMKPRRVGTPWLLLGARSEIRYEPRGIVLILSPWNYPILLTLCPLAAAIAAGNSVMLRPSEKVPETARVLGRIIRDAFAAEDVALVGGDVDVAERLLRLPFDHFFFTGSTRVGRKVMAAAAEHLATVTLELGGKSPAVVDEHADIRTAAARIVWGKFLNAGQTCVAPDYVLVHEAVERQLVEELTRAIGESYGDNAARRAATTDFCRVVDDGAYARLDTLLEDAVRRGARIEIGGERDASTRYIAPTVLTQVPDESRIMREEIFGPILPVVPYRSTGDAVQRLRAAGTPLASYVFSDDEQVIERLLRETSAGGSVVNNVVLHLANPELPFGGAGESGQGSYHGWFGFRALSHERAIMRQRGAGLASLAYPPYGKRMQRLVKLLGWLRG